MSTALDVEAFFAASITSVNAYLSALFPETERPPELFAAMNYSLLAGGKRLRPTLCLAVAQSFGIEPEAVLPAAAALELLHCYSLIHDDLPCMDDDDLRRGRPTNHRVFGEALALLAGDALLTAAFSQLAQPLPVPVDRQLEMLRVLGQASGASGMVGGQVADLLAEQTVGSLDELSFIHVHKTARLIQASVIIGGLFADLSPTQRDALAQYGEKVGLAFQMMDDWLDVVGTVEILGKQPGVDESRGKLTYPRLVGLDETKARARAAVAQAVTALHNAGLNAPLLEAMAAFVVARSA